MTNLVSRLRTDPGRWLGLTFAVLMLAIALGMKYAIAAGLADPQLARRAAMAFTGILCVVFGNAIPKQLTPLAVLHCDGSRVQAFQRFLGWMWVLSGLALVVVSLTLPYEMATGAWVVILFSDAIMSIAQAVRAGIFTRCA